MKPLALLVPSLLLAACASAPEVAPTPPVAAPAPATAGAIFRAGGGLGLFRDSRAREVGDVLTVVLEERTQARSSAATKISKDSSAEMSGPAVMGGPVRYHGRDLLNTQLSAERDFSGDGDTSQSNQLSGNVTVTVIERLANGNLVIQGEKELKLNQGDEVIKIRGIVRPADIAPDNTIASSRVAGARISYTGRGSLAGANAQGWLSRFFNSRWMPF